MEQTTLAKTANRLGVHVSTLSNILNGRRGVSWKLAKKLAIAAPETSVQMWMDGETEKLKTLLGLNGGNGGTNATRLQQAACSAR